MGVVDFHNISVVTDYFHRLDVSLTSPGPYNYSTLLYDFETGLSVPAYVPASQADIGAAFESYINIIATNYSYLQAGYFLPDPIPEELLIPFGEFVNRHGLQASVQLLNQVLQNDGNLWEVPTIQVLKSCDISLARSALEGFLVVASGDTQDLYTSAAAVLGQDVLFNAEVTQTSRNSSAGVDLMVQTSNGGKHVRAKRVIITVPPLPSLLGAFDLDDQEVSTFGKLQAKGYYGAVFTHSGINGTEFYTNIGTDNPFNLQVLPGIFTIQPTGLRNKHKAYLGTLDPLVSSSAAQQIIVDQINTLQDHGAFPADMPEFLFFNNHSPFRLSVAADDIRNGFYRDLYGLQGRRNVFWTGGAWITQDSSLIWNFTETQVIPAVLKSLE